MRYTLDLQLNVDASAGEPSEVAYRWLDEMSQAVLPDGRAEIADLPARVAKTEQPYGPQGRARDPVRDREHIPGSCLGPVENG